jgi:inner membrane protein
MASFGHVAVGMLAGRLHGGGTAGTRGGERPLGDDRPPARARHCSWAAMLLFAGLALLPDADVLLVALGTCDAGACGHRGASHSLPVAVAIGLLAGLAARRLRWPVVRTVLAVTFAVGSHALLDVLGAGGRGLPLLWPFSEARFMSPIRIFPDAPRGMALLSIPGVINVAIEFAVFLPVMVYALWPRIAGWLSGRAVAGRIAKLPSLTFIGRAAGLDAAASALEGAASLQGAAAGLGAAPEPTPAAAASDAGDPPLRSAG